MFSRDQYDAAHRSAIITGSQFGGTIAVTGSDRAPFLHGLLTNDIAGLAGGSGAYAAYLTPQGRMISDMRIVETGDRMLVGVDPQAAPSLAEKLDTLIFSEDVQVRDVTADVDIVGVHGPSAASMIQRVTGVSVTDLAGQYDNRTSGSLAVIRDDGLGLPGFDVYAPKDEGPELRASLEREGAAIASAATNETLRIEALRPKFGIDMTNDTIPLEAGIERRAISFTKGCYVGQEVIVRVMHRGHGRVAKRLVAVAVLDGRAPARGEAVLAGDRPVGEVTSSAVSPKVDAALALAYVQRDFAAAGTELRIGGSEARVYQPVD